jgi:polysaccharide pyruvyl transferase CsaB
LSGRLRALALGYQGFGNVGDEAILAGLEALLADGRVEVATVIGGPEPIPAYASARRVVTRRMRPNLAALRALRRSRLVIISGGGLLHDHWWTVVPTYLAWVVMARLAGARVVWAGVGLGPLRRRSLRRLAGWALRLSTAVTVRDPESADLARALAARIPITVVPDPAFLLPVPASAERRGIGVIVRGPTPGDQGQADALATALAEAATRLDRLPGGLSLITFGGPNDRAFAEQVAARASLARGAPAIEELSPDPQAALRRIAALEAVVSVRLHGCILAALAGTPVVPIAYDPKVSSLAARLDRPDDCLPLEGLTGTAIVSALERAESPLAREMVAARLAALRGEASLLRDAIEGAVP